MQRMGQPKWRNVVAGFVGRNRSSSGARTTANSGSASEAAHTTQKAQTAEAVQADKEDSQAGSAEEDEAEAGAKEIKERRGETAARARLKARQEIGVEAGTQAVVNDGWRTFLGCSPLHLRPTSADGHRCAGTNVLKGDSQAVSYGVVASTRAW